MADRIEDPAEAEEIKHAVIANFQRGVQYYFFISKGKLEIERDGYFKVFEVYAHEAMRDVQDASRKSVEEMVKMVSLDIEWPDFPYVFYRLRTGGGECRVFAYRGRQRFEGIAEDYELLSGKLANTIFQSNIKSIGFEFDGEEVAADEFEFTAPSTLPRKPLSWGRGNGRESANA